MASGFRWFHLWTLAVLGWAPAVVRSGQPRYVLYQTEMAFDEATEACAPGTLTTLITHKEIAEVLRQVAVSQQNLFSFWVGLKKAKNECVVPTLPLKGFKWTDGGQDTDESRWWVEPKQTCTNTRCAALTGTFEGSTVTKWGLESLSCRNALHYICKLGDGQEPRPATPHPATPQPATPQPATPALPTTKIQSVPEQGPGLPVLPTPEATPKPARPIPDPGRPSAKPEPEPQSTTPMPGVPPPKTETERQPAAPKPDLTPTPGPAAPEPGPQPGSEPGPGQPGPDSGPKRGLYPCTTPFDPNVRSFSPDQDNSSSILMECWSKVKLKLFCGGRPQVWRLVDHSAVNFTTICQPCDAGFTKDAAGRCVDVDECAEGAGAGGSGPCKRQCVNTEGSYRCVCADQDGRQHEEGSPECVEEAGPGEGGAMSGILIPVLAAVAALVVLVVIIAVTVKCCLMRRERKRELKEEEEERMAMKKKGHS